MILVRKHGKIIFGVLRTRIIIYVGIVVPVLMDIQFHVLNKIKMKMRSKLEGLVAEIIKNGDKKSKTTRSSR